jgi:pathogenesis-related protein 1
MSFRLLAAMLIATPVLFGAQAFAQMPANTGSKVVASDAQAAVDFHKAKRKDVGSPPLAWSNGLAGVAQQWADHLASLGCNLQHTQNNKHGENLFAGAGKSFTAVDASQSWYDEIQKYHYGPLDPNNWAPTGHYTQMVWHSTTQMGMGRATCPNGLIVIVAEYDPPGNYMGQKPY